MADRLTRISKPSLGAKGSLGATEDLVASLLSFLVADSTRFARFLTATGVEADELRAASATDGFPEHLLDYVCSDQRLLVAFAAEHGSDPAAIEATRLALVHRAPGR